VILAIKGFKKYIKIQIFHTKGKEIPNFQKKKNYTTTD
jgi:hypothetical protein